MTRLALLPMLLGAVLLCADQAGAQPLVDRVIDRVQGELDSRLQPIPEEDEAAPAARPVGNDPGYLGVIADDRREQGRGVRILEVVAGGPAELGGLQEGDLITTINLTPVRTMDDMARVLTKARAGDDVEFGVRRGDETESLTVTLGARPAPEERRLQNFGRQPEGAAAVPVAERPRLGVRTLPVTAQAQAQFRLPTRDGAIVVAVTPGSPAERGGLRVGAVITDVDGQAVRSPDHLAELVAGVNGAGGLSITAIQDGRARQLTIPFGAAAVVPAEDLPPAAPAERAPRVPVIPPQTDEVFEPADKPNSDVEALERRLRELEDRIEKLEERLDSKT